MWAQGLKGLTSLQSFRGSAGSESEPSLDEDYVVNKWEGAN